MKRILRILVVVIIISSVVFAVYRYRNSRNSFFDVKTSDTKNSIENSIVQITVDTHTGTGLVWSINADTVIIVSNKHLLANEGNIKVTLVSENTYDGTLLSISNDYDLAFCTIKRDNDETKALKTIAKSENYELGDKVSHVGVDTKREDQDNFIISFEGELADYKFIPEFYELMLVSRGLSKNGMSGGAILNSENALVGLLSGGEEINDSFVTYAIPLTDIDAAFCK